MKLSTAVLATIICTSAASEEAARTTASDVWPPAPDWVVLAAPGKQQLALRQGSFQLKHRAADGFLLYTAPIRLNKSLMVATVLANDCVKGYRSGVVRFYSMDGQFVDKYPFNDDNELPASRIGILLCNLGHDQQKGKQ